MEWKFAQATHAPPRVLDVRDQTYPTLHSTYQYATWCTWETSTRLGWTVKTSRAVFFGVFSLLVVFVPLRELRAFFVPPRGGAPESLRST